MNIPDYVARRRTWRACPGYDGCDRRIDQSVLFPGVVWAHAKNTINHFC